MTTSSLSTCSKLVKQYLVQKMQNSSWSYQTGQEPATEATAWCALALGDETGIAATVAERFSLWQNNDGGWSSSPGNGASDWTTSLALIALRHLQSDLPGNDLHEHCFQRGISFLLNHRTELFDPLTTGILSFAGWLTDQAYPIGWPWNPGTFNWVEPTAYAMLALKGADEFRYSEIQSALWHAEALLMSNSCIGGGWNLGNRTTLGAILPPYPVTTAQALLGLQHAAPSPTLGKGLHYLHTSSLRANTTMSLSWAIIALKSHQRDISKHLQALMARQKHDGSFGNNLLLSGLAACALAAADGHNPLHI